MSKFTPGPWRALISDDDGNGWRQQKQTIIIETENQDAMVAWYSTESAGYPNDATNAANARLIAASPAMYEALLKCREWLQGSEPGRAQYIGEVLKAAIGE